MIIGDNPFLHILLLPYPTLLVADNGEQKSNIYCASYHRTGGGLSTLAIIDHP